MNAQEFREQWLAKIAEGDRQLEHRRVRDAIANYSQVAQLLRQVLEAQEPVRPGGPTQVPLHFRRMLCSDDLTVVLFRLAEAFELDGQEQSARDALEEIIVLLERVILTAGGETRDRYAGMVADARRRLDDL